MISRWPDAEVHFLARSLEPVRCDEGLTVIPTDTPATLADPELIVVPGSGNPVPVLSDQVLIDWLRTAAPNCKWTASVCTGAGLYAAAGLLEGKETTTHWAFRDNLRAMGVEVVGDRVMWQGNHISGAGVSAGIDMALSLTERVHGREVAESLQLAIEYDPQPPFQSGSPSKADASTLRLAFRVLLGDRPVQRSRRCRDTRSPHDCAERALRYPADAGLARARDALEPVEAATVTILVDNLTDAFMPDEGPARRFSFTAEHVPRARAATLEGGEVIEQLRGEHGFSTLVTFSKGGREHRVLFDTGVSPDGLVHNMRFLEIDPETVETVVLSHGHFDHTTGLDGFVRAVGRANVPVVIHPEFWSRRRLVLPGREPWELPSTSRGALEGSGCQIVEERQPSFLFERSLLVTGEVDGRSTASVAFRCRRRCAAGRGSPIRSFSTTRRCCSTFATEDLS